MAPHYTPVPGRQQDRSLAARFESLDARLAAAERRQLQLKHTLDALAREAGVTVGCQCSACERSYTLVKNGHMYCPACGANRSL